MEPGPHNKAPVRLGSELMSYTDHPGKRGEWASFPPKPTLTNRPVWLVGHKPFHFTEGALPPGCKIQDSLRGARRRWAEGNAGVLPREQH